MKYGLLIGRILFSLVFISGGLFHFSPESIAFASAQGVPMASVAVPLSGLMAIVGGLGIMMGYKTKIAAWIIVAFIVPVTFMMHNFWALTDPAQQQMHMPLFFKGLALTGAALLLAHFGAGPLSLDNKTSKSN